MAVQVDFNYRRQDDGLRGRMPAIWAGENAVDGDADPFAIAGVGSMYVRLDYTNDQLIGVWVKNEDEQSNDDWSLLGGSGVVSQRVSYTDFTDGAGASGTLTLNQSIPAGAFVERSVVTVHTAVTGTSTVLTIGDGTDADRYNTSTIDVSGTGVLDGGAVSGTAVVATASDVVLTLTEDDDFGDVDAGVFTVKVYYRL